MGSSQRIALLICSPLRNPKKNITEELCQQVRAGQTFSFLYKRLRWQTLFGANAPIHWNLCKIILTACCWSGSKFNECLLATCANNIARKPLCSTQICAFELDAICFPKERKQKIFYCLPWPHWRLLQMQFQTMTNFYLWIVVTPDLFHNKIR